MHSMATNRFELVRSEGDINRKKVGGSLGSRVPLPRTRSDDDATSRHHRVSLRYEA